MVTKKECSRAILISLIALLGFLGCEKLGKESPTGVDATTENQVLAKGSLPAFLLSPPDIIVSTTLDVADFDGAQQIGDLPGPDGVVSLREAIIAANNTEGPNVIGFNIPRNDPGFDGVVFTIKPISPLPGLWSDGTTINGATQADFTGNTNEAGPEIVVDGGFIDPLQEIQQAFNIGSSENHIHSLVITHFSQGIAVGGTSARNNRVTGCYIGTDPTGSTLAAPPLSGDGRINFFGIGAQNGPSGLTIGGTSNAERNIVAGYMRGIFLASATNITIENNFIGTDVTGRNAIPNSWGIAIGGYSKNVKLKNNLISGNVGTGITMNTCENIQIKGNIIGPDINGNLTLGNGENGISFHNNDPNDFLSLIQIGGTEPGEGNIISGNGIDGIIIGGLSPVLIDCAIENNKISYNNNSGIGIYSDGQKIFIKRNAIFSNNSGGILVWGQSHGNWISENSIYENNQLGIDLFTDQNGVTSNDPGDIDTGPNNFMNFPVLTSAKATPGKLHIKGTIDTPNPKTVTIEFFANPVPNPGGDPSGHGEGAIYLGSDRPNPQGKFTATLPTVAPGTLITATATDADGNTSEFAANIEAR